MSELSFDFCWFCCSMICHFFIGDNNFSISTKFEFMGYWGEADDGYIFVLELIRFMPDSCSYWAKLCRKRLWSCCCALLLNVIAFPLAVLWSQVQAEPSKFFLVLWGLIKLLESILSNTLPSVIICCFIKPVFFAIVWLTLPGAVCLGCSIKDPSPIM